jgi:hypothetical protein
VTRRLYTWAIGKDLVETSPCLGLSKPGVETQRDRVLSEDEIRAVWAACDAEPGIIADAFRLMLVTAQRRGEVLSMRWQDVDGAWWTIPAEVAKNGRSHRVPLSPQALAILARRRERVKGPWVFPSPTTDRPIENPQKAAERLRERSNVPDLRLHDFRRTATSLMTGMGISRLTVKKILNHAERDVTAIYDRHSYDPEKRTTLEAWGRRDQDLKRRALRDSRVRRCDETNLESQTSQHTDENIGTEEVNTCSLASLTAFFSVDPTRHTFSPVRAIAPRHGDTDGRIDRRRGPVNELSISPFDEGRRHRRRERAAGA